MFGVAFPTPVTVGEHPQHRGLREGVVQHLPLRACGLGGEDVETVEVTQVFAPVTFEFGASAVPRRLYASVASTDIAIIAGKNMTAGPRPVATPDRKYTTIIPTMATTSTTGSTRVTTGTGVARGTSGGHR